MWTADNWKSFEIIDTSDGMRLERWNDTILVRPDPQVIWRSSEKSSLWKKADAVYNRSKSGGGSWNVKNKNLPEFWKLSYRDYIFKIKLMGFKHTGIFPEQATNWDWMDKLISEAGRPIRVLNLFAYTGGATVACAKAGASVCHVDASKGMVSMAKENASLSGLERAPIRYIVDDCFKFAEREIRRQNKYDAIIMDPPSYGRGPSGEMWKLEECIGDFLVMCEQLLSEQPLFLLLNSYTAGLAPSTMEYLVSLFIKNKRGGFVESNELGIMVTQSGLNLPCGASVRWTLKK